MRAGTYFPLENPGQDRLIAVGGLVADVLFAGPNSHPTGELIEARWGAFGARIHVSNSLLDRHVLEHGLKIRRMGSNNSLSIN